ncbi:MAG: asparagine synthase (glutamine-hydrolyzing) [bacterium]
MCGICGVYNFGSSEPVKPGLVREMTDALYHRGPDEEGFYVKDDLGLGMRRLAIIDLTTGQQPVSNEDGSIWIVFNGEIYNYRQLRDDLILKGHQFKTKSDTEVIVHLYEEAGEMCVRQLGGMFAFAIWDRGKKKLTLARDRLGIKPLYYWLNANFCLFGSEIKALLKDSRIPRQINYEALDDYFTFRAIPSPRSIFKGIYKLPPGHILTCTPDHASLKEYWDVEFTSNSSLSGKADLYAREENYAQDLIRHLKDSVESQLISEVPLGVFLSGGIDSSAVVAVMSNGLNRPVITSSIGFSENGFDETKFARLVAHLYQTTHYEHTVRPELEALLPKLIYHFDEPFADSSAVPTYYLSKTAREHVTVALSGDGGDELFAGYRRYFYDRLENKLRGYLPRFIQRYLLPPLAGIYPKADYLPQFLRAKTLLTNLSLSPEQGYANSLSLYNRDMRRKLYSEDLKRKLAGYDPADTLIKYFKKTEGLDPLSRIQYVDIKTYLPDDILTKVDRMSMANSLEVRVPLLDHQLVEFAATIPPDLKLKGDNSKYIFKKAVRPYLSPTILERGKMGFSIPADIWFRKDLKGMTEDILFDSKTLNRGYFNSRFLHKMWRDHQSGLKNYGQHLWALLMLEMWHREFV